MRLRTDKMILRKDRTTRMVGRRRQRFRHADHAQRTDKTNTGENINMTYTTEEKRTIAELRHESKMDTLDQIAKAEGEYNRATATHKATLDRKIAEYELKAKNTLKTDITAALATIRTDETETDEDDNDE